MVFSARFRPKKRQQPIDSWLSNHHHHVSISHGKSPSSLTDRDSCRLTPTSTTTTSQAIMPSINRLASSSQAQYDDRNHTFPPLIPCYLPYIPRLSLLLSLIVAFTIACLCYINSLNGELVHDDIYAIVDNQDVVGNVSWKQMLYHDFWGTSMSSPKSHKSYRPLTVATFRCNYYLHGLQPFGYHIVNVLLHAMVCSTLLLICHRILRMSIQLALLTSIFFAVHPIHTEAVAGIVGRAEILSCLFFLLAVYTYAKCVGLKNDTIPKDEFAKTASVKELLSCFIFTFVAMLSKEQGITAIAICLVYDVAIASRKGLQRCLYHFDTHYLKLRGSSFLYRFGLMATYLIAIMSFRLWIMNGQLPKFSHHDNPAVFAKQRLTRIMTLSYLPVFNFWLLLFPRHLCYDWQMGSIPLIEKPTDIRNCFSLCFYLWLIRILSGLFSSFLKLHKNNNNGQALTIGFALLIIPFIPALNIFFPVGFVVAERVLYLPSMGYCVLVVLGLNHLSNKATKLQSHLRKVLPTLVYTWLIVFSCRTMSRNAVWKTREALFRSAIEVVPTNAKVFYNYANYLKDHRRFQEAASAYKTALTIAPDHASSSNNLATITQDDKQSEELYQKAIHHNPYHARAYFNYGNLLRRKGKLAEALDMFNKAISIEQSFEGAWVSLTATTGEMGNMQQASILFEEMLRKFPQSADIYNNYGVHLTKLGRPEAAIKYYDIAIGINAAHHVAIVNKGRLLRKFGQHEQAEKHYRRALNIERSPETLYYLATLLLDLKRHTEAIEILDEAIRQNPQKYDYNLAYCQCLANLGKVKEAISKLRQMISSFKDTNFELEPSKLLASVLTVDKQPQESLKVTTQALRTFINDSDLHFLRGEALKDLQRYNEAEKSYLECVRYNPRHVSALMHIGVIRHIQNDLKVAQEFYKKAYELNPTNTVLKSNMEKLSKQINQH